MRMKVYNISKTGNEKCEGCVWGEWMARLLCWLRSTLAGDHSRIVGVRLLVLELGSVDTRVGDVSTLLDGVSLSNTGSVLEKDDILVVLNKLHQVSDRTTRFKSRRTTHETVTVRLVERDKHVLL